ncbi:MAG TPA: uracil-DNA glycosylase [Firmicutes bacterium]|nr:uracil-DNA glycosylase [Bacillota bacterium]
MEKQVDLFRYLQGQDQDQELDQEQDQEQEQEQDPHPHPAPAPAPDLNHEKKGPAEELGELGEKCLECQRCSLREGAQNVIFGEGSPYARIIFIGEGPGAEEDRIGRPFVGAAGLLLDRILAACNLKREEIYIANVVKCRPRGNRTPQKKEIDACLPLLKRQIEIIDAPILVCLGAVASKALIEPAFSITAQRGRWLQIDGRHVMPTFHPAALLRDPRKKRPVWEDMQKIMEKYRDLFPEGGKDR